MTQCTDAQARAKVVSLTDAAGEHRSGVRLLLNRARKINAKTVARIVMVGQDGVRLAVKFDPGAAPWPDESYWLQLPPTRFEPSAA